MLETAAVQVFPSLSANGNGHGAAEAPLTAIAPDGFPYAGSLTN